MRLEQIQNLVIFAQVAKCHSFTSAAAVLGISKAAVSTHVKAFERELGLQLLNRSARSVSLTDAGRKLLDGAERMIAEAEGSIEELRELTDHPAGHLRIAASVGVGTSFLAPLIPQFLQHYPEMTVELSLFQDAVDLAATGFDVGFKDENSVKGTDTVWPICKVEWWLVASPSYVSMNGLPCTPSELAHHACLTFAWDEHNLPWHLRFQDHVEVVSTKGPFKSNSCQILLEAAIGGAGIAALPRIISEKACATGSLIRLLPKYHLEGNLPTSLVAVRPWSPRVPRTVRALIEFLRSVDKDASFLGVEDPDISINEHPLPSRGKELRRAARN